MTSEEMLQEGVSDLLVRIDSLEECTKELERATQVHALSSPESTRPATTPWSEGRRRPAARAAALPPHSTAAMVKSIQERSQAEYEAYLINEIAKLRETLVTEEVKSQHCAVAVAQQQEASVNQRLEAMDRANRAAALEDALIQAQEEEQMMLNEKRAAADERQAKREADTQRLRDIEKAKKEQQRAIQMELHRETMERAAREREELAEAARQKKAAKEAANQTRLDAQKAAVADRNQRKSEQAAAKIMHAAKLREQLSEEQRADFRMRHAAQLERLEMVRRTQEEKVEEQRQQAAQRREQLARAQESQRAAERQRIAGLVLREEEKDLKLQQRSEEMRQHRQQRSKERMQQMFETRERVERSMDELKLCLDDVGNKAEQRAGRVDYFEAAKEARIEQQRHLSRETSLQKHLLANDMSRIHHNVHQGALTFSLPLPVRENLRSPELRELFEHMDQRQRGAVSLKAMKKALNSMDESQFSKSAASMRLRRMKNRGQTSSLPSLLGSATLSGGFHLSNKKRSSKDVYDALLAAFKHADADGSGHISKRELYSVMETAGIQGKSHDELIRAFDGFDINHDGKLSFEEFERIATALK